MSVYRHHRGTSQDPGYLKSQSDKETTAQSISLDSRLRGNDGVLSTFSSSFPRRRESRNRLQHLPVNDQIREFSGFTLFELLVVILIISLISAFVMPRMTASLPGVKLKSTTRAVAASLRYARSKAVSESRPYVAILDNSQKLLAVEPILNSIDGAALNSIRETLITSKLKKIYEIPNEIDFAVLNHRAADERSDVSQILFFPHGDSTGANIVLQNPRGRKFTVTVDRITGSVEVASGDRKL